MKRLLLALIVVALASAAWSCTQTGTTTETAPPPAAAPAPAPAPAAPAEDVEAIVTQLERDWVAAIVKKDSAAIEQLLAQEFVGTSPTAHTFTRSDALSDLKSGTYVVASMDLDEISVNVFGDTAVAFTSQEEKSKYRGERHERPLPLYRCLGEKRRAMAGGRVPWHALR